MKEWAINGMNVSNNKSETRIENLSEMLSYIMKIPKEQTKEKILSTKIGAALVKKNVQVLYEQQTSNLEYILEELGISETISSKEIEDAYQWLLNSEKEKEPLVKTSYKKLNASEKNRINKKIKAYRKNLKECQQQKYYNLQSIAKNERIEVYKRRDTDDHKAEK